MNEKTKKLVGIGLFTAIVIVLQVLAIFLRPFLPLFTISLCLAPIIIGGALYGTVAGGWLGFVFGVAVLISGDANAFLAVNPIGTILTVLVKGAGAGLAAAFVHRLLEKKNGLLAVITAGIVAPVTNTGIFLLGCKLFFMPTLTEWAGGTPVGKYLIFTLVGANFLIELVVNMVLSSVIVRLIKIGKNK